MSPDRIGSLVFIVFGLAVAALGYGLFTDVVAYEAQGGTLHTSLIAKSLYALGGKFAVLGVIGGIGALIVATGVHGLVTGRLPRDKA